MHFINADRLVEAIGALSLGRRRYRHGQVTDDAGSRWPQFRLQRVRVGLERQDVTIPCADFKFVACAFENCGKEYFPHTAFAAQAHGMPAVVPEIEIAKHGNARGIRCPHRKTGADDAIELTLPRAEDFIGPQMRSLAEQPDIGLAEDRREAVGVVDEHALPVLPGHA